jgi:hypothetical protein
MIILLVLLVLIESYCKVPGVVIDYVDPATKQYVGSPSVVILSNGHYVATHDLFGPGSTLNRSRVFSSINKGRTWTKLTEFNQFWSNLFVHRDALYVMGPSAEYGHLLIRKSLDGGKTWTNPVDDKTGLLISNGEYHTAPVPIVVHNGRIWRACEDRNPPK